MKKKIISTVLAAFVCTASAFADTGKIELGPVIRYIASPKFGKALAEASDFASGWKIRIDYVTTSGSRTTAETVRVTLVGRTESKYLQSTFDLKGVNGGWRIEDTEVQKTEITQEEFVSFEE